MFPLVQINPEMDQNVSPILLIDYDETKHGTCKWSFIDILNGTRMKHMVVSQNVGTPRSSILMGFSLINHPFGGSPTYGNPHLSLRYDARMTPICGPPKSCLLKISFQKPSVSEDCRQSYPHCWSKMDHWSSLDTIFQLFATKNGSYLSLHERSSLGPQAKGANPSVQGCVLVPFFGGKPSLCHSYKLVSQASHPFTGIGQADERDWWREARQFSQVSVLQGGGCSSEVWPSLPGSSSPATSARPQAVIQAPHLCIEDLLLVQSPKASWCDPFSLREKKERNRRYQWNFLWMLASWIPIHTRIALL